MLNSDYLGQFDYVLRILLHFIWSHLYEECIHIMSNIQ